MRKSQKALINYGRFYTFVSYKTVKHTADVFMINTTLTSVKFCCVASHLFNPTTHVWILFSCFLAIYRIATYKFSRNVIFEVFAVNWPSAKFSSSKFHWWTLTCMNQRAGYLVILENKIAKCLICDILEIYVPRKFVHIQ